MITSICNSVDLIAFCNVYASLSTDQSNGGVIQISRRHASARGRRLVTRIRNRVLGYFIHKTDRLVATSRALKRVFRYGFVKSGVKTLAGNNRLFYRAYFTVSHQSIVQRVLGQPNYFVQYANLSDKPDKQADRRSI